jgi:hypothetical protein
MSLNNFSNNTIKDYLSVGCDKVACNEMKCLGDIKCNTIEIGGFPFIPSQDLPDSSSFSPTLGLSNATLGNFSAYYSYNKNVMNVIINADFTITTNTAFCAFSFSSPPNYKVKLNLEKFPAVGTMNNNVSTPFTPFDTFTQTSNNTITCDFRQNGVNMISGQIGKLCFYGTFLAEPV